MELLFDDGRLYRRDTLRNTRDTLGEKLKGSNSILGPVEVDSRT